MMTDETVVYERLCVQGFGPYRDRVHVVFPKGLGVLALPNEKGKSTLVHALTAVLFGLPHVADPTAFGTGRFRNRHHPTRFEGELELARGSSRFRIVRNFDDHRVSLSIEEGGTWRDIAVGEHNPNARRPNPRYETWLLETFGHTSRALFEATYCVVQPLPMPDQLDASIQTLLTGGKGGGPTQALDALAAEAKRLTRATGALGVTARDGRKDGVIEALEAEIDALRRSMAESQAGLDALKDVAEKLAEADRSLAELEKRRRRIEAELDTASRWLEACAKARGRRDDVAELARASRDVHRAEAALRRAADRLKTEYPEFDGLDDEIGEALLKWSELTHAVSELDRLNGELETLAAERGRKARARERAVDWDLDGMEATSWARAFKSAFHRANEELAALDSIRRRVEALRRERYERFGVFEEAAPALLEEVADHKARRAELQRDLEAAEAEVEVLKARVESVAHERRALDERFARVAGRAGALREVEELAAAMDARKRIEGDIGRSNATLRKFVALSIAAGTAAVSLFAIEATHRTAFGMAGVIASVVLAAIATLAGCIPFLSQSARAQKERKATVAQLRAKERHLLEGALSWVDAERLHEVKSDLLAYREALDMLAKQEERDAVLLASAKERASECRIRLDGFDRKMSSVVDGDVDDAYRAWRALLEEERRAIAAAAERLEAWNVPAPGPAGGVNLDGAGRAFNPFEPAVPCDPMLLGEPWPTLTRALQKVIQGSSDLLPRVKLERFGDVLAIVDALGEEFWREIEGRAATHDALSREILALDLRSQVIEKSELPRWRRVAIEIVSDLERLFPGDWTPVRDRIREQKSGTLLDIGTCVVAPLSTVLAASGGDVDRARARCRSWEGLRREAEKEEANLTSTLAAWGAKDASELDQRIATAQGRLQVAISELEAIAKEDPSLPDDPDGDLLAVKRRVELLKHEKAEIEQAVEDLRAVALDFRRRQAELEGVQTVNVAGAEVRLRELTEERDRLRLEAEALASAYTNLKEAAEAYYSDHIGRLKGAASARFAALSGRPGRRVTLSEALEIGAIEPDGAVVAVSQLSLGTQDLLYIALRLAIADLMAGGRRLPFLFDDPFLNFDADRLARMRDSIERLSHERQAILFTHREELSSWGERVLVTVEGVTP